MPSPQRQARVGGRGCPAVQACQACVPFCGRTRPPHYGPLRQDLDFGFKQTDLGAVARAARITEGARPHRPGLCLGRRAGTSSNLGEQRPSLDRAEIPAGAPSASAPRGRDRMGLTAPTWPASCSIQASPRCVLRCVPERGRGFYKVSVSSLSRATKEERLRTGPPPGWRLHAESLPRASRTVF